MPVLMISSVKLKDEAKYAAYGAAAGATLDAFGGKLVHKGAFAGVLLGDAEPHNVGIIQFPDLEAAQSWFQSPAYRELAPLRDAAADMSFVLYQMPA